MVNVINLIERHNSSITSSTGSYKERYQEYYSRYMTLPFVSLDLEQ